MPSVSNAAQGLAVLRDVLKEMLSGEPQFDNFGGVTVFVEDEVSPQSKVGGLRIVLEGSPDAAAPDWGHTARQCTVTARVEASAMGGARVGVENPASAHFLLSRWLEPACGNYDAFNVAGLWGIQCGGPIKTTVDGAIHTNEHRIVFSYDPRG